MTKKLAIFDFDGTLVDSMRAWDSLGAEMLHEYGMPDYPDYDEVVRTMSMQQFAALIEKKYPGLSDGKALIESWNERMRRHYHEDVSLRPGAFEFLGKLKEKGIGMCLASATDKPLLEDALTHFGLKDFFGVILTEGEVGASKKEPLLYSECIRRFKQDIKSTIVFEDVVHAVRTAAGMGLDVCVIEDAGMEPFRDELKQLSVCSMPDFSDAESLIKLLGL